MEKKSEANLYKGFCSLLSIPNNKKKAFTFSCFLLIKALLFAAI